MIGTDWVMPKSVTFETDESNEEYGRFVIEPLERGFGVTLGNSLRRVLLSSLSGTAIVSVKFDGVQHEFSTLPKVKEDVTDIILQLKQVRFKKDSADAKIARLEVKGPSQVKAGDIEVDSSVTVLNPDLKIATVDAHGTFRAELTIDRGRGYVTADIARKQGQTIGVINIDAIFTPVTKVNYLVEETRVGQKTDYDKLTMEIWTDGAIRPDEALRESARILMQHLEAFAACDEKDRDDRGASSLESALDPRLLKPLSDFELSVRAVNCLRSAQIYLIGDLVQKSEPEMLKFKNFGKKSLEELEALLVSLGLQFGVALEDKALKAIEEKRKEIADNAAPKENE